MKVAICDDEIICRAQLTDVLCDYIEERRDAHIEYDEYRDPNTLLQATRDGQVYDIYILDVIMPDLDGIKLGQALRAKGVDGKIIYLTSSKEHAIDSFRVRAFDYILKPVVKEVFYKTMDEAISSINIKKDKCVIIKTKDGNARIALDNILYVENANRLLIYHLADGKDITSTTLRTSFSDAMQELVADERFYACGVGTVVNLNHITSVENEGVVFGDKRIFLNKKLCRELRGAWNNYWISREG